ncbi:MAG: AAA family ATPase [Pseudomonadota bacterium]
MDITKIEINEQFAKALEIIEQGSKHLFVTGKAGTGKSTLLQYFRETTKRQIVVLAPTGVAAVNIGGQTIHSFFGFKPDITIEKAQRNARKIAKLKKAEIYCKLETLVIDEISMVRADLFDCVDAFMRIVRGSKRVPFGGANLVMIGDLYQLPPVVTSHENRIFQEHYKSPFFFDSHVYSGMDTQILELEKIYRQSDKRFIEILNAIRNNTVQVADIEALNKHYDANPKPEHGSIYLTSLNKNAAELNDKKLSELKGRTHHFNAEVFGQFDEKSFPANPRLRLKVGAQVMLLNNDSRGRWINGTIGEVVGMNDEFVDVKLADGTTEEVEFHTWEMFRFELDAKKKTIVSQPVGSFMQLPLMLAWAITIHKSQGKTFDRAVIDFDRVFACGQAYVALSRLRSLEGLVIKNKLKKNHVRVDWRVVKFLTGHHYDLSEKRMPLDRKIEVIEQAIENRSHLAITYLKSNDVMSKRVIMPLEVGEMEYSGKPFIGVLGTCKLRSQERVFRVDRILEMAVVEG